MTIFLSNRHIHPLVFAVHIIIEVALIMVYTGHLEYVVELVCLSIGLYCCSVSQLSLCEVIGVTSICGGTCTSLIRTLFSYNEDTFLTYIKFMRIYLFNQDTSQLGHLSNQDTSQFYNQDTSLIKTLFSSIMRSFGRGSGFIHLRVHWK